MTESTAPTVTPKQAKKLAKKQRKREQRIVKANALVRAVRLDERRRFEEEAREWAAEMENEHINAQNVLAKATVARHRMELAHPDAKPLSEAYKDILE